MSITGQLSIMIIEVINVMWIVNALAIGYVQCSFKIIFRIDINTTNCPSISKKNVPVSSFFERRKWWNSVFSIFSMILLVSLHFAIFLVWSARSVVSHFLSLFSVLQFEKFSIFCFIFFCMIFSESKKMIFFFSENPNLCCWFFQWCSFLWMKQKVFFTWWCSMMYVRCRQKG